MFKEDSNGDITIVLPNSKFSARFKSGRLNSLSPVSFYLDGFKPGMFTGRPGLKGCTGLKMIEEALAVSFSENEGASEKNVNDIFFMGQKMIKLAGWNSKSAVSMLAGSDNVTFESIDILNHDKWIKQQRAKLDNSASFHPPFAEILDRIEQAVNSPSKIVTFSTKDSVSNSDYDIAPSHVCRITGIDKENQTITISNPWHDAKLTTIPVYEFLNYVHNVDIAAFK